MYDLHGRGSGVVAKSAGFGKHELTAGRLTTNERAAANDADKVTVWRAKVGVELGERSAGRFQFFGTSDVLCFCRFEAASLGIEFKEHKKLRRGGAGKYAGKLEVAHVNDLVDRVHAVSFCGARGQLFEAGVVFRKELGDVILKAIRFHGQAIAREETHLLGRLGLILFEVELTEVGCRDTVLSEFPRGQKRFFRILQLAET